MIERRQVNQSRVQETIERAQREYFPKLRSAPGLIGFSLIPEEATGIYTAILAWEDKAHADAFMPEVDRWTRVLDEHGHVVQSDNRGETAVYLEPRR